jgi:hypothetical protein
VATRLVQAAGRRLFSTGSGSGGGDNKRAAGIMGSSWSPMAQLSDKLSKKLANMGAKDKIEKVVCPVTNHASRLCACILSEQEVALIFCIAGYCSKITSHTHHVLSTPR